MNPVDEDKASKSEFFLQQIFETLLSERLADSCTDLSLAPPITSRIQKPYRHFLETNSPTDLILEIFTEPEGCLPLLIEKWKLSLVPSISEPDPDSNPTLQDLKKLATNLPRSQKKLNVSFSLSPTKDWQKYENLVKKEPKLPISCKIYSGLLSISCEYLQNHCSPEIRLQDLGARPRLNSVEVFECMKLDELTGNDVPIVCLDNLKLAADQKHVCNELTRKTCTHEHSAIGFAPLSHTICSETASNTSFSSFLLSTPELFDKSTLTDDAAVSLYKLSCERLTKSQLFSGRERLTVAQVKGEIIALRKTLDLL